MRQPDKPDETTTEGTEHTVRDRDRNGVWLGCRTRVQIPVNRLIPEPRKRRENTSPRLTP